MVIFMPRGSVVLLPDVDGGLVAAGVAPRVRDVAALVEVLFGERWAVN